MNRLNIIINRIKRKLNFRQKIVAIILLFTLIPVIILGCLYIFNTSKNAKASLLEKYESAFKISSSKLNELLSSEAQKINFIVSYNPLYEILNLKEPLTLNTEVRNYQELDKVFSALFSGVKMDAVIYTTNKFVLHSNYIQSIENLFNLPYWNDIKEIDESGLIWKFNYKTINSQSIPYLSLYKRVVTFGDNINLIEVNLNLTSITDLFDMKIPQGTVIIFNADNVPYKINKIDCADNIQFSLQNLNNPSRFYKVSNAIFGLGNSVEMYMPQDYIWSSVIYPQIFSIILFLLVVFSLVFAAFMIARQVTSGLFYMVEALKDDTKSLIGNGTELVTKEDDEFAFLSKKIIELINKVREEYLKEIEYRKKNHILEIELLQEKMNPHFLYNTLSAIKIASSDIKLGSIIDTMVKYYRIALNKGDKYILLERELDGIDDYLKIQKFSFEKDFYYTIEIENDVRGTWILRHLIQPIVENAFFYAVNQMPQGEGFIKITIKGNNGDLVIKIEDNGEGIPPEKLDKIMGGQWSKFADIKGNGYAINNIIQRIKMYYGCQYGLNIESGNNGTTVTITTPILWNVEETTSRGNIDV